MPRFTSHGEVCYEADSKGWLIHPFWGEHKHWWPGAVMPSKEKAKCGSCGGNKGAAPQPSWGDITLEQLYAAALKASVDLNEHIPLLKELSSECESVGELSSWINGALVALASGQPKRLMSICHAPKPEWTFFQTKWIGTFVAQVAQPLNAEFDSLDMLFISTKHTADVMSRELALYAHKIRKYLVLQNTQIFGERGDDGSPGLMVAARAFLSQNPQWKIKEQRTNNNGMLVLERIGAEPEASALPQINREIKEKELIGKDLEDTYRIHVEWDTPIHEHLPTLRELASQCDDVIEFGVATASSTVALLAGQPKTLRSYDTRNSKEARALKDFAGKTDYEFIIGDSRQVEPKPCDLLYIDTHHVADVLWAELTRHAPLCRRWIVLHDTVTYGEMGEGNNGPGLLPALRRYLAEHPEWFVKTHYRNNNGLMVLSRDLAERKPLPSLWKQGVNAAKASWRAGTNVLSGYGPLKDTETQDQRLALCMLCESRNENNCAECGCPLDKKTSYETEFCPLGKWPARTSGENP